MPRRSQLVFAFASMEKAVGAIGEDELPESVPLEVKEERVQVPQGVYVVKEVFGGDGGVSADGAVEDEESECIVCLSSKRDTVLLPCRHMCVCTECAQQLRQQTNKCPVCRSSVALLLRVDPAAPVLNVPLRGGGVSS